LKLLEKAIFTISGAAAINARNHSGGLNYLGEAFRRGNNKAIYAGTLKMGLSNKQVKIWMKSVTDYWTDMTWITNGNSTKDTWTQIFTSLPKLLNMTDLQKVYAQIWNDASKSNGQDPQVEIETTLTDWDRWSQVLIDRHFYIKQLLAMTKHQLLKNQLPSVGLRQTIEAVIAKENGEYLLQARDRSGNIITNSNKLDQHP
jgi:hypothetical protein